MTTGKNIALTRWTFVGKVMQGHLVSGRPGRLVLRPVVTGVAVGLRAKKKSRAVLMKSPSQVLLEFLHTAMFRDLFPYLGPGGGPPGCLASWQAEKKVLTGVSLSLAVDFSTTFLNTLSFCLVHCSFWKMFGWGIRNTLSSQSG